MSQRQNATGSPLETATLAMKADVLENALFFRSEIGTADLPDGRRVEIAMNMGGGVLLVSVRQDGKPTRTYQIRPRAMVDAVLEAEELAAVSARAPKSPEPRPMAPAVANLIDRFRAQDNHHRFAGGCLHVQLDDGNLEDQFFQDDARLDVAACGCALGLELFDTMRAQRVTGRRRAVALASRRP